MAKDFNQMLRNAKDMPKVRSVTVPKTIERYGGERMTNGERTKHRIGERRK